MKVFEFKQIESGSNFRIEIDYHHYMQKQTAWLDGDILEMGKSRLNQLMRAYMLMMSLNIHHMLQTDMI